MNIAPRAARSFAPARRARLFGAGVACWLVAASGAAYSQQDTAAPVAPEEMRLPVAPAVGGTDTAAQSAETLSATDAFAAFRRDFDAGRYEAAVPYARRVLQLTEAAAKTPADEEVQVALMNLAMTQYLSGDYLGSEAGYLRAIELVESSGRSLHARLARAYAGLAASYHKGNRHDLAVKNFEHAVALTRRDGGLLTEAQVPIIQQYIDSLTELRRYPDALQLYKYVLRIMTRKYGDTSPALAPTLERIGRWYTQVGAYDQARRTLRHAMEIVVAAEGEKSPKLVGPLTALAQCNRRQLMDPDQQMLSAPDAERATLYHDPTARSGIPVSPSSLSAEGERALLRAAEIADQRKDPSPVQVADVRTQLGDWYQVRALPERALPHYQQAWMAASRVEQTLEGQPVVEALFGKPLLLQVFRPEGWDRYAGRPPDEVETRNVVVEVTVSALGRAEQPSVLDDSGDPKRAEKTTEALKSARYRPRMDKGQPVATSGVTFTQPWILLLPTPADGATPLARNTPPAAGSAT